MQKQTTHSRTNCASTGNARASLVASLAAVAVFASIASSSFADTKYSVANDASGQYSFRRDNWQAAGDSSPSVPASGNDYVAVHSLYAGGLSNDTMVDEFAGDSLQIGEVGGTAGSLTALPRGKVMVPSLILANGNLCYGGRDGATCFFGAGRTTVRSPATAPFVLGYLSDGSRIDLASLTFENGHEFAGDETSGLAVKMSKALLTLQGGSPDYRGKWCFQPWRALTVVLGSPEALGGNRTAYAADAIQLAGLSSPHRSAIVFDFDGTMPDAGKGITFASGDWIMNVTTGKVECAMPMTKSAGANVTLTVAGGSDAMYRTTDGNNIPTVRDGYVSDGHDALMLGTVAVPTTLHSGTLCVTNFAGGTFTLKSKARIAARIHRDGTADATSFAAGTVLTVQDAKIPLHVYGTFPLTNATTRIAVLKIPTATRTVSAGDFDVTADDFDLMEKTVEIVTEGGIQTVYLTLTGSVVYYSSYFNNCNYNMPAQYWSDNQSVHNTADYLIGYDVSADCTFIRGVEGVPFGGKSLTFAPGAILMTKGTPSRPSTIGDMRCWPGTTIKAGTEGTNTVTGSISLRGNPTDGGVVFAIEANDGRSFRIDAGISGSLPLKIQNQVYTSAEDTRMCEITSENPGFTGSLETSRYRTVVQGIRLVLHDELNLGGNPETFNAAHLRFACKTVLEAADTLTIDDSNRGLTVTAPCTFDVGEGKALTLDIPMVLNGFIAAGPMVKTGAGTLGIGGTVSGNSAFLTVSAGYVRPVKRAGSSAIKYTFADGAGLELALSPSDPDVAADGLYVNDSSYLTLSGPSLPATISGSLPAGGTSVKCAIVNVPSGMETTIASALGGTATFVDSETGKRRRFAIERETLSGDRVRFFTTVCEGPTVLYVR